MERDSNKKQNKLQTQLYSKVIQHSTSISRWCGGGRRNNPLPVLHKFGRVFPQQLKVLVNLPVQY